MKAVFSPLAVILLTLGGLTAPRSNYCESRRILMHSSPVARDEISKRFPLASGALVEVMHFPFGSVVIEPTDSSDAEVRVVRTAGSPEELKCNRVTIDYTATKLTIRGNANQDCTLQNTSIDQGIVLKVPRSASVTADEISGPVRIGEAEGRGPNFVKGPDGQKVAQPAGRPDVIGKGFDGVVLVRNISGSVKLVQGSGAVRIAGVIGALTIAVRRFNSGTSVDGINGSVNLQLVRDIKARFELDGIRGDVKTAGGITVNPRAKDTFSGEIGSGGPPISLSNIIGDVTIWRAQMPHR